MEGRGPQLSDLRESGAIEQDADIVLFLSPTEDWSGQAEGKRLIKLDVAKNRNGATGEVNLNFDGNVTRFSDYAYGIDRENPAAI